MVAHLNQKSFKLFTAIEIVFIIFILIVVTLVVIQMVQKYFTAGKVEDVVVSIEKSEKWRRIITACNEVCDRVKAATNAREVFLAEVEWCSKKIEEKKDPTTGRNFVDIVPDGRLGFFIFNNNPYCEDSVYCFLFSSCDAGITLDIKECRKILCEYWTEITGSTLKASKAIKERIIQPGVCSIKREDLKGINVYHTQPNWWHNKYFNMTDSDGNPIEDFCSILLSGRDVEGDVDEGEEGGGPPPMPNMPTGGSRSG